MLRKLTRPAWSTSMFLCNDEDPGRIDVVKDAETREAEAKKRGKALKFLKMKSAKHSTSESKGALQQLVSRRTTTTR